MKSNHLLMKKGTLIHLAASVLLAGCWAFAYPQDTNVDISSGNDSNAGMGESSEAAQALFETIAGYQSALEEYNGVYDESASELYLGLADAYTEIGDFEEANRVYSEALQSLRITTGLYSEPQLDLLDRYMISAAIENDWETVDTNLNLISIIAGHLYGNSDYRYTEAISRYASWKIIAYQQELHGTLSDSSVREAIELYDDLIDDMSPVDEGYTDRVTRYLSAKGMGHYHSALYIASIPLNDFQTTASSEYINVVRCHIEYESGPNGVLIPVRVCEEEEVLNPEYFVSKQEDKDNQVRSQIAQMRTSFRQAADLVIEDPDSTLEDKVTAILNLGDVNFLIQEFGQANSEYSRAEQLLITESASQELKDRMIGRPDKILDGLYAELPFDFVLESEIPVGTVSFDVRSNGNIENISLSGTAEALSESNQNLVMGRLENSIYRPRIENGRPVDSRLEISAADL